MTGSGGLEQAMQSIFKRREMRNALKGQLQNYMEQLLTQHAVGQEQMRNQIVPYWQAKPPTLTKEQKRKIHDEAWVLSHPRSPTLDINPYDPDETIGRTVAYDRKQRGETTIPKRKGPY